MITIKQLDEALKKIGFKVGGRHPNMWILNPDKTKTKFKIWEDRIEIDGNTKVSFDYDAVTCFYYKDLNIEFIDDNAVSINGNKCVFILLINHKIPIKNEVNNDR